MNFGQKNSINQETIIYTDEALEFGEEIQDFLPCAEELAKAPKKVTVTLSLDIETLALLKQIAKKRNVSYHELMEKLLQSYADRRAVHSNSLPEAVMG